MAKIGFWEVDLVKNTVFWSEITKQIHEVPEDYVPNLKEGINFYKEGKDRELISQAVSNGIATGEPWDVELIIVTAKGRELWVRAQGEAELANGKAVRLFGTFQDIDDKKRKDLAYSQAMERLALATNVAKIGVWDYDVVQNNLIWDDNMFKLYGLNRSNFSGEVEAWESSVHPEDKKRGQKELALALAGEKEFNTEFRIIQPTGEIRRIKATATVKRDQNGHPIQMIGTNWDITELKETQLQLERTIESFNGAFENSSIGMALVGLNGKWITVNNSLCKSIGYTSKELMGLTFQDLTHPDDLKKDLGLLKQLVDGEIETYQIEKRYFHKKGHIVYVLLTVTAVHDIDGNLSHFISQIVDITSRVEAQRKQQELNKIALEQNKNLMNFAHIVSHNLRSHATNMTMLLGFLSKEKDGEEFQKILSMLQSASLGLNETVDHLNEVVQIKTTTLDNLKSVNLWEAIAHTKNNIRAQIDELDTTIKVNVPNDLFIKAVPAYLDSILLNLFTNALKYSSTERAPIIEIDTKIQNGKVELRFSDNGLGIDLDRHGEKIFGMFKTFHRHKDAKGIGLFITKNQVEAMGGKITVESEPNLGTSFILTFDLAKKKMIHEEDQVCVRN
ncbi:sensor histidine kinase [Flagellimonas lutaonensis]|nr:HAMP domain-containing sensor histidine kinase [Allomuricauda lutaonensis]